MYDLAQFYYRFCIFLLLVLNFEHVIFLCLGYPMLPVSLDCPFWLPLRYSLTFISDSVVLWYYLFVLLFPELCTRTENINDQATYYELVNGNNILRNCAPGTLFSKNTCLCGLYDTTPVTAPSKYMTSPYQIWIG
jgi:hypothetical protein